MTSTALKISVIPQDKVKGSKKMTKADPTHSAQSHKNKKAKIQSPSLSLFSQMLLEAQQSPSNQASQAKLPKHHLASHSSGSQRKAQLIQSQKTLLTQNKLKMQKPAPSHETQNQLREALMLKSDRKTTKDIQKIAQDQNLNLTKLEVSQKNTRGVKKTLQKEKPAQIAQNTHSNKAKTLIKEQKNKTDAPLPKDVLKSDKTIQNPTLDLNQTQASTQLPQNTQIAKDSALASLLSSKEKEEFFNPQDKIEEKKGEKNQDVLLSEVKKETQFKIAQSRETLNHFSQRLKEEIANYKPPFTKLSMELNPQELGKLEITITKKGKELQVSVNANNPNALQAFIQNQNEFKNTLANIGFNSVELNFSQSDSGQQKEKREGQNQKGNKNSFEELKETPLATSMEIKMVQYA